MRLLSSFALLSALAIPMAAHADVFVLAGSAGSASGSATVTATSNGNNSFTIGSIAGSGAASGASLIAPNGFQGNDNLLFPFGSSVLDTKGFAFSDTVGNTSFNVNVAQATNGYQASFRDSDGNTGTVPVTLSLATVAATPEPASWALLGTGALMLAGAGLARRRFTPARNQA
ncbi:MAG TPA: PEP-CTERM sorting domain-containing protein [Acidobacteriaceae bacterium]|nr:PEP-CTERM sorting domain-containing protein [Acidobacteriaceae bacterium]